jgi:hypothetical protein
MPLKAAPEDMQFADIHRKRLWEWMHCGFGAVRVIGCAVMALLAVAPNRLTYGQSSPPRTSIPEIASIGKVQLGYSTQEDLARKWGQGKTLIGGHPNSGRVWRIAGTGWRVQTDGFDYSARGLVVDQLSLFTDPDPAGDIPAAKLSKRDFCWLRGVSLGMSRTKVLEILQRRSLPNTLTKDGCELTGQGFSALKSLSTPFRKWKATLSFANDVLIRLDLSAQTDP